MRTKYRKVFTSQNEPEREFTLTFVIESTRTAHIVVSPEVYDKRRDVFLSIGKMHTTSGGSTHFIAESIFDYLKFDIDILPLATGCALGIIERVITTIASEENLQPCN